MNIQELKTHQKLLAVILGVAVIASVGGSLAYAQTAGSEFRSDTDTDTGFSKPYTDDSI
ncbi:hypothetical protein DYY67_0414 [Candidatus Nitrosotalea sp. TS]|uniref:hypothetical protein n=1 Tax=Candidatus Nitrosotalea sp. TS TaxID=2341020 RepID=UPI00140B4319|nr:hypothetical protein [Candidatus Nitrosotalea sp. TS]NHI02717.1 hypothetical protein [Candidatus Nitrosotalea sp. TS]